MEVPIGLATDTTDGWEHGDTTLLKSELAIEIAGERPDGTFIKYLLVGDGQPVGPNAQRLRATPELIAGLVETLQELDGAIADESERAKGVEHELEQAIIGETNRAQQAEEQLQHNIENQETYHDDTLTGSGIEGDPLSVVAGSFEGLTSKVSLNPNGTVKSFQLPFDFLFAKLSIVMINGLGQEPGIDYTLEPITNRIVFTDAPESQDIVSVYYTRKEEEI